MCSSGVRPATWVSKRARGTPRRAASGHRPARQLGKLAAAARMACAVMSGCPEAPDSPLHSGSEGRETLSCLGSMGLNSARKSKPWEKAGALTAAASAAPMLRMQMKRLALPIVLLLHPPHRQGRAGLCPAHPRLGCRTKDVDARVNPRIKSGDAHDGLPMGKPIWLQER